MPALAPVDSVGEAFEPEEASPTSAEDVAELDDVPVASEVAIVASEVDVAVGAKSKIANAPQPLVSPGVTVVV